MTRYRIDADDAEQFRRIKDLVEGRTRVFLTSERRLFVATGDLPDDLRRDLLDVGAHIVEERPHHLERGTVPGGGAKDAAPVADADRAPDIPPLPPAVPGTEAAKQQLLAWMRTLPPQNATWTREDKYRDHP